MPRKKKLDVIDEIIKKLGNKADTYAIESEMIKRGYPPTSASSLGQYLKGKGFKAIGKRRSVRSNWITVWAPREQKS